MHWTKLLYTYEVIYNLGIYWNSVFVLAPSAVTKRSTFFATLKTLSVLLFTAAFYAVAAVLLCLYLNCFTYRPILAAETWAFVTTCLPPAKTFTIFSLTIWLYASTSNSPFFVILFKKIINFAVLYDLIKKYLKLTLLYQRKMIQQLVNYHKRKI